MKVHHLPRLVTLFGILLVGCSKPTPIPTQTAVPTSEATRVPSENNTPAPTSEADPVTVSVAMGRRPVTLDPVRAAIADSAAQDLIANLYVGLTTLDPETGIVEPAFAERWERSADGLTWTVYLRDDVFWVRVNPSTGEQEQVRAVTAADVVYSVRRACRSEPRAPLIASVYVIAGCREVSALPPSEVTPELVEQTLGARVLNDVAVEFRLVQDTAVFATILASPILYPVPFDLVDSVGEGWTDPTQIWTSGSYALDPTTDTMQEYHLIANSAWPFERTGNVQEVRVNVGMSAQEAYEAWNAGTLAMSPVPPEEIASTPFGDDPRFWLQTIPETWMLAVSYDTPPMERPGVRRAFSLAIDREALINDIREPQGVAAVPAVGVIPPGLAGAPGSVGAGYDPEAARAAMAEAGYPDCIGFPGMTLLVGDSPESLEIANRIREMWIETLKCNAVLMVVEQLTFDEVRHYLHEPPTQIQRQFRPLRAGMILFTWQADYVDAHNLTADVLGCRALFVRSYLDAARECVDADQALVEAEANHDPAARVGAYQEIEEAYFGASGEMPAIPLFFTARALAFQEWVEFYPIHAGPLRFDRWIAANDAD